MDFDIEAAQQELTDLFNESFLKPDAELGTLEQPTELGQKALDYRNEFIANIRTYVRAASSSGLELHFQPHLGTDALHSSVLFMKQTKLIMIPPILRQIEKNRILTRVEEEYKLLVPDSLKYDLDIIFTGFSREKPGLTLSASISKSPKPENLPLYLKAVDSINEVFGWIVESMIKLGDAREQEIGSIVKSCTPETQQQKIGE